MKGWIRRRRIECRWHSVLMRAALMLVLGGAGLGHAQGVEVLPEPLRAAIAASGLPPSAVGVWIQRVDEEVPLAAHQGDTPFNPASTIKLATTFTALAELGVDHQWMTDVRVRGTVREGVLDGDLVLVKTGDPGLNTERYFSLIAGIRRAGVREIRGDVILDGAAFSLPFVDPGAFDGQPLRAYNQPAHALHVNASAIQFYFYVDGDRLRVETDPPLPGLRIDNRVQLGGGSCGAWQRGIVFDVSRDATGTTAHFTGTYPRQCGAYNLYRVALTPEDYAAEMFRTMWRMQGGSLSGQVRVENGAGHSGLDRIYRHASPPLAELLGPVNKWSNNVHARHMAMAVGAKRYGAPATLEKARRAVLEVLAEQGVDVGGMVFDNGSGLSRVARMTPRQMGALLVAAHRHPTRYEFVSSMSIAGVDGTFRRRFQGAKEAGRIHVKTGRLNAVSAVAAMVRSDSDREYVVVVMMGHADAHGAAAQRLQDSVLAYVAGL
ncbi:MAG: D-alanyl-D-alanine carboxypeptidase/D-alanyl-D-alanine-endopeptidase [Thioalkalivibrionaceae bacterium]